MMQFLTESQLFVQKRARDFASRWLAPVAAQIDREGKFPKSVVAALATEGWLGATLPSKWGGGGMDSVSYGLATEEIGKVCSSARSLLTCHNMAANALLRYGSEEQLAKWMPQLCLGEKIIAFALTEENAGSVAKHIVTEAVEMDGWYRVTGTKVWITFGLMADFYLLFAIVGSKPIALIVERDSVGLTVEPMPALMGTRGSMIARLLLSRVEVPFENRIGGVGAGITFVANSALDHGRFSVACGATGLIQASLDSTISYVSGRSQGGVAISEHQLVRRHLTRMLTAYTTAQGLYLRAAQARDSRHQAAAMETMLAKYYTAETAVEVTTNALRLHGANGYSENLPIERYHRDALALEIIEGTREICETSLASYALRKADFH